MSLSGRVLFVFSDPGGAKPCLALIKEYPGLDFKVYSDRYYSFYKDFGIEVNKVKGGFNQIIDKYEPNLIFTGTSYTSSIEKTFIKLAREKNIVCFSFVDHWTSIIERFKQNNGLTIFPQKIWVIDELAKEKAVEQGINPDILFIKGNPFHKWLRSWKPKINKQEFLKKIGIKKSSPKLIVYAPDPLSNVNGLESFGFDEVIATKEILQQFEQHLSKFDQWLILIKPHPNQDIRKLKDAIGGSKVFVFLPQDSDSIEIIHFADIVLGFFSSFLIEASVMGKTVLRYLETDSHDPIKELNIGTIVDSKSLVPTIEQITGV